MKVEILYFEGCPNRAGAVEMVRRVLEREGIRAQVVELPVEGPEAAEEAGFLGSPSIRVDGVDIEPGREKDAPTWGCRTYTVGGRTLGLPPEEWLVTALRRARR